MDLHTDIKHFWDKRQERIATSKEYAQIEKNLDEKIEKFKKELPPELLNQFKELEELCVNKRYESNTIVYQKAFREGFLTFIFTIYNS